MADVIEKYSPNIVAGFQSVEIVLMAWKYRAIFVQRVQEGIGFAVFEEAIEALFDELPLDEGMSAMLKLTNEAGDTLLCVDEEFKCADWLKRMVVSARIIAWEPPSLNEMRAMNGAAPVAGGDKPYDPG